MKLYTSLPKALAPYYHEELRQYACSLQNGNLSKAWNHLERAHIIGQRYPAAHSYVHWKMLLFGIQIKNAREIMGQIPRLFLGGVKSFVGTVPIGNPGGANVPPMRSYPIAEDINLIFEKTGVRV